MAKKKRGAKKVARKAAKVPVKLKPPIKLKPPPAKTAPLATSRKPKATFSSMPKSSVKSWPGKDKGYPDPFHVASEGKTATDRIFVMKEDPYIWDIYKRRKIIIPLTQESRHAQW